MRSRDLSGFSFLKPLIAFSFLVPGVLRANLIAFCNLSSEKIKSNIL